MSENHRTGSSRRRFLQTSAVLSLGAATPGFWLDALQAAPNEKKETILVVIQLSGGNDGLNTVVPYRNDRYLAARPVLGLRENQVARINDELGLHPALDGFSSLLEEGKLGVVQGVGYPNPNRSHFESMDVWHTCLRKGNARNTGWLGRYLDSTTPAADGNAEASDVGALHLGHEKQPLALAAERVRTPSIASLDRFRLQTGGRKQMLEAIQQLTGKDREAGNDLLSFVQSSATSALAASQRVEKAVQKYQATREYPATALAEKLKVVAQLIDAGLRTRVYYVTLDGFDTHSQQADAHAALLGQLGGAVSAFLEDVAGHGHGERVAVFSFSEFGRRLQENASEGTDHGAAAPVFLAGSKVRSGLIGEHPSLEDLDQGDVKHHTDFRQVYASLLEDWLGFASRDVLGGEYQKLKLFG